MMLSVDAIQHWTSIVAAPAMLFLLVFFLRRYISNVDDSIKEARSSSDRKFDEVKTSLASTENSLKEQVRVVSATIKEHEALIKKVTRVLHNTSSEVKTAVVDMRTVMAEDVIKVRENLTEVRAIVSDTAQTLSKEIALNKGHIEILDTELKKATGKILDLDVIYKKDRENVVKTFKTVKKLFNQHDKEIKDTRATTVSTKEAVEVLKANFKECLKKKENS